VKYGTGEKITMRATGDSWFVGRFNADDKLFWCPVSTPYTMVISNRTQAISSPISVSNGTFAVEGSADTSSSTGVSFPNLTGFNIYDGGTVRIGTQKSSAFPQLATLNMSGSARFEVTDNALAPFTDGKIDAVLDSDSRFVLGEDKVLLLKTVSVDGNFCLIGMYTGGDSTDEKMHTDWIQGSGTVVVTSSPGYSPVETTWDGGGDTTSIRLAQNWEDDMAPNLGTYLHKLVFASAGTVVNVDTNTRTNGIKLDGDALPSVFDITGSSPSGFSIGDGGIVSTLSTYTNKTVNITAPVSLFVSQTWAPNMELKILGDLTSLTPYTSISIEAGNVTISNDNSTFTGPITVSHGKLFLSGALPLGESDNKITINNTKSGVYPQVEFQGGVIRRPIQFNYSDYYHGTTCKAGTTTILEKQFTFGGDGVRRFAVGSGTLVFKGGIAGGGLIDPSSSTTGWYIIRDTPLNNIQWYVDGYANLALECTNNSFHTDVFFSPQINSGGAVLETRVENAIAATSPLGLYGRSDRTNNHVYWNLCGLNQQCGQLKGTKAGTAEIYSDEPATLTFNETVNNTNNIVFKGAVALVKNGAAEFQMTGASTSTGGVHVAAGKLTFGPGAKWAKDAKRAGVFEIDSGAKLELADGVQIKVCGLRLNGERASAGGTWGSSASPAGNKNDTYFSGQGVLYVQGGTCVMVR